MRPALPFAALRRCLLALAALVLVAGAVHADERPADWAQPVDKSFNLYRMSPTLYRSALPEGQDLALLQQLGVHTVLSFIKDDDKAWTGAAPLQILSFPTHADRVDDADVIRVLNLLQAAQQQGPVLMHCKHGSDRTGLFSAMYRTVVQGWSKEDALEEMREGGFGSADDMTDAVRYVQNADIDAIRQAMAEGRCSPTPFSLCHLRGLVEVPVAPAPESVAQAHPAS